MAETADDVGVDTLRAAGETASKTGPVVTAANWDAAESEAFGSVAASMDASILGFGASAAFGVAVDEITGGIATAGRCEAEDPVLTEEMVDKSGASICLTEAMGVGTKDEATCDGVTAVEGDVTDVTWLTVGA